jgi:mannose-6-phosphate isomerase
VKGVTQIATVIPIEGIIRPYAWGSLTAIPRLLGVEPSGEPAAELWLGAHPDAPSRIRGEAGTLDELITADPVHLLGQSVLEQFGPRLPFLLKVLAAEKALSIQVHPTLAQAKEAFARQQAGKGTSSSYTDDNHKPELVCAITPFEAFCGFRPVTQILDFLESIERVVAASDARELVVNWRNELARPEGIRAGFGWLYGLEPLKIAALVQYLVEGCTELATSATPFSAVAEAISRVADDFPGDVGLAVAIMLNYVVLAPGEALFLGAGNVHAYVRGLAVEVMANSDNVLRCGLTAKHIDVAEVLRIADFTSLPDPRFASSQDGRRTSFCPPVADFSLHRWAFDDASQTPAVLTPGEPRVLLVTDGVFTVSSDGRQLLVTQGEAVFVPANVEAEVTGVGTLFEAAPGLDSAHLSRLAY